MQEVKHDLNCQHYQAVNDGRKVKNKVNQEIKAAKRAYYNNSFNNYAGDQRKTWKTIIDHCFYCILMTYLIACIFHNLECMPMTPA